MRWWRRWFTRSPNSAPAPSGHRAELGRRGERHARRLLRRAGYRILHRNWRCALGEVDLIAREQGDLVFVEVKAKRQGLPIPPEEMVTPAKRRKLVQLARAYLQQRPAAGGVRFDVVALWLDEAGGIAEHRLYRHAFTADEARR